MYPDAQVIEGIMLYIKNEMLPVLPSSAKLMVGAVLLHNRNRAAELLTGKTYELMRTIDLVSVDGNIDVDTWSNDIRRSMDEFCGGRMEIQLPMLSPIIMTSSDVETLKRYMKGEIR